MAYSLNEAAAFAEFRCCAYVHVGSSIEPRHPCVCTTYYVLILLVVGVSDAGRSAKRFKNCYFATALSTSRGVARCHNVDVVAAAAATTKCVCMKVLTYAQTHIHNLWLLQHVRSTHSQVDLLRILRAGIA